MPRAVRTVLLGNSFASRVQLPALRWAGGCEVVGIAGRDGAKARRTAEEWSIPHATADWRELLALEPELVIVTTPVDLHREMTLAALETGAAVLCEKPFALSVAEAEELLTRASERGASAWIDHELRWSPHVRGLRALVRDGFLGEPWHVAVSMHYASPGFRQRPHGWWFEAERGGGVLGALGSHLVDLVRFVLDGVAIESARCQLATYLAERPDRAGEARPVTADEHATLDLLLANGTRVAIDTSMIVPHQPAFELLLTGSEGHLRLVDGEHLRAGHPGAEEESLAIDPPLPASADFGITDAGIFGRCLPLFLRDVLGAVRGNAALPEAADFADGLAVQEALDAARRSHAQDGAWVAVA